MEPDFHVLKIDDLECGDAVYLFDKNVRFTEKEGQVYELHCLSETKKYPEYHLLWAVTRRDPVPVETIGFPGDTLAEVWEQTTEYYRCNPV